MKFLKDSFREIKHVVWPTTAETKKYFLIVVTLLVLFGLYIFVFSTLFTNVIFYLKDLINN
jgi:preprotein translocase SecE subunit